MAVRFNRRHQEMIRAKIKTACILQTLDEHLNGKRELSKTQVASAKILLDKSMSNAPQITQLSGVDGAPLTPPKITVHFPNPKDST